MIGGHETTNTGQQRIPQIILARMSFLRSLLSMCPRHRCLSDPSPHSHLHERIGIAKLVAIQPGDEIVPQWLDAYGILRRLMRLDAIGNRAFMRESAETGVYRPTSQTHE
jgi:hypothetical protein